jgi:hypothetical protein
MMKAHFFDIESILSTNAKVWIVDRKAPKFPLMKITESDFNLIRKGIYRSHGNQIKFAGKEYWLPNDIMENLKIRCKNLKTDISSLGFSMREYMDSDIIDTLDVSIKEDCIRHLKNSQDDIYVICSSNTKNNYSKVIEKMESKLKDLGVSIKKYYFISETFYERDSNQISRNKVRLVLQHLIGLKTEGDMFIEEELKSYDEISYYDEDQHSITFAENVNRLLDLLVENSNNSKIIKSLILDRKPILKVILVTENKANRFIEKKIALSVRNAIKTFESFSKWKR